MFAGKKVGILGMGEAGRAAAKWLKAQGGVLSCYDDKAPTAIPDSFVKWCRENQVDLCQTKDVDRAQFAQMELLVVSPGVPPWHPFLEECQRNGIAVVGELYLAASMWKGPMVGITGTNGKTTTTFLASHLIGEAGVKNVYAGNISPSLFEVMDKNDGETCAVLEISSFQLEYFPDSPVHGLDVPGFACGVCLNVAPDHLDRHGDMDGYKKAKEKLFSFVDEDGFAVLGEGAQDFKVKSRPVFLKDVQVDEEALRMFIPTGDETVEVDVSSWPLMGRHNMENLAAAIVAGMSVGASVDAMEKAMGRFKIPPYRLEKVASVKGVEFINDSKATNIHAVITGLKAVPRGQVVLIAGGRVKGEDFSLLARQLRELGNGNGPKVKAVVLIGEAAQEMAKELEEVVGEKRIVTGTDGQDVMERAVSEAFSMASEGDKIMLSPACASFDLFNNYKARGEAFNRAVQRIVRD